MNRDRIRIPVPAGDERRVEREVFGQLAAMRSLERAEAMAPRRQTPWFVVPAAFVAAVAIALVIFLGRGRGEAPSTVSGEPSIVVTPVGGSSRFTVGDAIIDTGGDTSVEVQKSGDGVTLVLQRGTVDCDVAPREGRPPFRVIGGNVHVEVVGTRFAVTRVGDGARVDVTRGKVHVRAPQGERFLTPGETWTPAANTAAVTPSVPADQERKNPSESDPASSPSADDDPRPTPPTTAPIPEGSPRPTTREAFAAAQRLEARDPQRAAKVYRVIANGRDAWAALALYSLAELHAGDVATSLRELDELARRFPNAANAEDGAWLRVDVLRRARRNDDASQAAAAYLRRFPEGTYAAPAAQLAPTR